MTTRQGLGGGPRTTGGKARSSRNAKKHGIFATSAPVVDGLEDEAAWFEHRQGVIDSLDPVGYLETVFAERVATCLWREHRVLDYERARIAGSVSSASTNAALAANFGRLGKLELELVEPAQDDVDRHIGMLLLPDEDTLQKITRYHTSIHRMMIQTLHELEALQARRKGEATPLARLDISGPPG